MFSSTHRLLKDREFLVLSEIKEQPIETITITESQSVVLTPFGQLFFEDIESIQTTAKHIIYVDKALLKSYDLRLKLALMFLAYALENAVRAKENRNNYGNPNAAGDRAISEMHKLMIESRTQVREPHCPYRYKARKVIAEFSNIGTHRSHTRSVK